MKTLFILLASASLSLFDLSMVTTGRTQDQDVLTKVFSVRKGGTLDLDLNPGSVEITTWSKDEVKVDAEDVDRPEKLKMTQSGNTVKVEYNDRRRSRRGPLFLINVPAEFSVNAKTSGGNVIEEGELKGRYTVETKGGNVEMDVIIGPVEVRSNGGNIKATKVDGDAQLKTNGGNITVKMTTGDLTVESGGGNIRVDGVGKKLKLVTGGGNVTLGDLSATADVRTGGGNLNVGKVQSSVRLVSGGGNVEVDGASEYVFLKTGGGNVRMKDIRGRLELTTGGGDVSVELTPNGKGESTIFSGGGDITLYVPDNAKANIEARVTEKYGWSGRHRKIDIRSDFKSEKFQRDEGEIVARYVLNGGGDNIAVETSNAVIEIRKLR